MLEIIVSLTIIIRGESYGLHKACAEKIGKEDNVYQLVMGTATAAAIDIQKGLAVTVSWRWLMSSAEGLMLSNVQACKLNSNCCVLLLLC